MTKRKASRGISTFLRWYQRQHPLPKGLFKRLEQLNWHYGRGEIRWVLYDEKDGHGLVRRKVPVSRAAGFEEIRLFRVRGSVVYFLRHQSDFSKPMRI